MRLDCRDNRRVQRVELAHHFLRFPALGIARRAANIEKDNRGVVLLAAKPQVFGRTKQVIADCRGDVSAEGRFHLQALVFRFLAGERFFHGAGGANE